MIILLALPIFVSQRSVYAKAGADWKPIAEFVAGPPGPNQAAYFAPRVPPTCDVVTITSRTAKTLYPGGFDPLRDLTLVSTAAAEPTCSAARSRWPRRSTGWPGSRPSS